MATISTIKPGGSGDFTTLQSWEDWADGQASGAQWAECYTGGDLGEVTVAGWIGTIDASNYPRIYAADGHRHNGDIAEGAYITGDGGTYLLVNNVDYVEIDGLRCSGAASNLRTIYSDNVTCKNLLVENTNTGSGQRVIYSFGLNLTIYNCIVVGGNTACQIFSTSSTGEVTAKLYNNTIYGFGYAGIFPYQDTEALTVTIKNNIVFGSSSCFRGFGSPTVTSDYNCIGDGTLTSLGWNGSNDLESQTLSAVLTDAANDDFSLVRKGPAHDSGEDLSDEVDDDAAGNLRPQLAGYDMGALELTAIISTIDPGGDGNYTTLQAWEDAVDGESDPEQWAECYSGGNLGPCVFSGWSSTPDTDYYPRIYVAEGEGHNGVIDAGAYISTVASDDCIELNVDYVRIEGLRISIPFNSKGIDVNSNNVRISRCFVHGDRTTNGILISGTDFFVNHCIIGDNINEGISVVLVLVDAHYDGEIYNCTVYNCFSYAITASLISSSGTPEINLTMKNNIMVESRNEDFFTFNSGGTVNITSDYNITSDTSLTNYSVAGENDIESQEANVVLADPANDDFTIKYFSPAVDAGEDLSDEGITEDIAGTSIPQGGGWNIGAFESVIEAEQDAKLSPHAVNYLRFINDSPIVNIRYGELKNSLRKI